MGKKQKGSFRHLPADEELTLPVVRFLSGRIYKDQPCRSRRKEGLAGFPLYGWYVGWI